MYSSDSARVKFRTIKPMISDVIDIFGKDVTFSDEDEFEVTVSVYTNMDAMKQLAKRCAPDIIILEPQSLADEIKYELEGALYRYES